MIKEYDRVKTLVEKEGFAKGTIGVVVSQYDAGKAYEVEIWDKKENPIDVVTYKADQIELQEAQNDC